MGPDPANEEQAIEWFRRRGALLAERTKIHADRTPVTDEDVVHLRLLPEIDVWRKRMSRFAKCPRCGLLDRPRHHCLCGHATPSDPSDDRPAGPLPVARACPACGCSEYYAFKPERRIAFAKDRCCVACLTEYIPATPRWAIAAFAFLGGGLLVFGAASLAIGLSRGHVEAVPGNAVAAAVGIACLCFAARARKERIVDPPKGRDR
jgi:hypothetical protein